MTTSPYFNHYNSTKEQNLFHNLVKETIQHRGTDIYYIPRVSNNIDYLFGESIETTMEEGVVIEIYPEQMDGWEGQKEFMTKFGLEIRDEGTFLVSSRRFKEEVTAKYSDIEVPRAGDWIFYPNHNLLFEITIMEDDRPNFLQMGTSFMYRMTLKRAEYNKETIEGNFDDFNSETLDVNQNIDDTENITSEVTASSLVDFSEDNPFSETQ